MKRLIRTGLTLGAAALLALPALAHEVPAAPPAGFKKVSSLVALPDFLPGMGTLYVDPATLPAGPFLGYDHHGQLVQITYMLPLAKLNAHGGWHDLGTAVSGKAIDHTDIMFNPGHPGVSEPHYHVTQWLIPHAKEEPMVGH